MWVLMPFQVWPFFRTTAYPAAPSSIRDPSVNMASPGRALSASALLLRSGTQREKRETTMIKSR